MQCDTSTSLLRQRGFSALVCAQFFGALNDNLYKTVVSLLMVTAGLGAGASGGYLSLAGVLFILPYLLFSGYAGHLADALDKRSVVILTKTLEVGIMVLALAALVSGRIDMLLVVLFLMATQSTFFSPAKYGILPEMLSSGDLPRANGLMEMTRYLAVILGTAAGGAMLFAWGGRPGSIGLALICIAIAGVLASLWVTAVPRSGAHKAFRPNPWGEIAGGLRRLARDPVLGPTVAGITFFESLATLVMLDVLLAAKEIMKLDDLYTGSLGVFVGCGMGAGCFVAGRLSGSGIRLGLVPLGSFGVALALVLMSLSMWSYVLFTSLLALLGFFGGFFFIPLNALLQRNAGRQEKGRLIATNNFVNMAGVLLASGSLWLLRDLCGIPADAILGLASLFAFALMLGALLMRKGMLGARRLLR